MRLPRWLAWILHHLSIKQKARAFDIAVDAMTDKPAENKPVEKTRFNTPEYEWRRIEQQKEKEK